MSDDYLWNRTGEPDPEVERLERLLAPLGQQQPKPLDPRVFEPASRRPSPVWRRLLAAAAVILATGGVTWYAAHRYTSGWNVDLAEAGTRRSLRLATGEWLETHATSRATVAIGEIGEVEVEPNTRVQLVRSRPTEHRMALERGKIRATIWAPPRLFFVDTPSAVTVDLGCAYTLETDANGDSLVEVDTGWVAFERDGRESFIPAGAACLTRRKSGPGAPFYRDAPDKLRVALHEFETEANPDALAGILAAARPRDAITLWHLLARVPGGQQREQVYVRMASLAPPPADVTRDGILAGNRRMLDQWWDSLGLDDASWFRIWKQPAPR